MLSWGQDQPKDGGKDHDEKPVKVNFDPSGYDKALVEALERDIVQRNPNIHWLVGVTIIYSILKNIIMPLTVKLVLYYSFIL